MSLPEPLHVCFVTGEYPPMRGGVGDYTACLIAALARIGVRCSVVTAAEARQTPATDRVRVYPAIADWGWRSWPHLSALLEDVSPDVVHLQFQTGAFGMAPAAHLMPWWLRLGRARRPFVVTFHDLREPYLFPGAGRIRRWAIQALRSGADATIVTNHQDLDAVRQVGSVELVPIGSNITPEPMSARQRSEVRAQLGIGADDVAIGYFGFVDPWKGVDVLVDAFGRLLESRDHVRLLFVGGARATGTPTPYEQAVRRTLEASQYDGAAAWTGYLPPDETSRALGALDVCALPFEAGACYRHGTLIAAIAHRLPIVTTDPPASASTIGAEALPPLRHGETALLVPPGDASALADALADLTDDVDLRLHLATNVAELSAYFEWERIARASLSLYERLIGRSLPQSSATAGAPR